jgi:hypothetical protein
MKIRRVVGALGAAGMLTIGVTGMSLAGDKTEITICHATDSNSHPYVQESPSIDSTGYPDVVLSGGHIDHTGPIWFDGIQEKWGDIIPPFDYLEFHFAGMNWDEAGQAIWNNGCKVPGESPAPTESPALTDTPAPTDTAAPAESPAPTDTPSGGGAGDTATPTQPPTDTLSSNTSGPSDGAWLLVVGLGVLLASVVVLTPARAKSRR